MPTGRGVSSSVFRLVQGVYCGKCVVWQTPVRGEGGRGGAESRRGQPSPFTLHNTAAQVSTLHTCVKCCGDSRKERMRAFERFSLQVKAGFSLLRVRQHHG